MIIGIGLDLAPVERFRFDAPRLDWFQRRIFTADEVAYAQRRRHWPEHLAGCFAAKEALRKAYGGSLPWLEIEVTHHVNGAPRLLLGPRVQQRLAEQGAHHIHLSITHTATHAAATVILERTD